MKTTSNRQYRRPNKLPHFKGIPKVGELLYTQDEDGEIFPILVLEVNTYEANKKKLHKRQLRKTPKNHIICLCGNYTRTLLLTDLRLGPVYTNRITE